MRADRTTEYAALIEALTALDLAPGELQVFDPAHPQFDASRPLLVLSAQFGAARAALANRYSESHPARAVLGSASAFEVRALPSEARAWLIEPLPPEEDVRSLAGIRAVMERLYGPNGCPWDREQTHESLRKYLLEECYEVVEAIDRGDRGALHEELGDLLSHIFMHTSMAQEQGDFSVEDVAESAARKMVRRHPHVFGDEQAGTNEDLWRRWEEIKAAERASSGAVETEPGTLDSVPASAPALQRAQSVQQRAERAGAVEPEIEALAALEAAARSLALDPGAPHLAALLWSAVRVARTLDVDAEEALREQVGTFTAEFAGVEVDARAGGTEFGALPVEARRSPWTALEPPLAT